MFIHVIQVKLIALVLLHFWNKVMLEKVENNVLGTMRVKLHRKKTTFLGSFTVEVSYVKTLDFYGSFSCENRLYVKSLCFSPVIFMIHPFWIIRACEVYIRLFQWVDCSLEQANEICHFLKKFWSECFDDETSSCGKTIYFPTFSSQ